MIGLRKKEGRGLPRPSFFHFWESSDEWI